MNHLRFLRYVDEVARVGSIRQAAERLHVAPSGVVRRLQELEGGMGTAIFEGLPRGVRLTTAGELFVDYIRSRNAELDGVRSQIEELKGLRRGNVRLVISQALAPAYLPQAVATFRRTHPLVAFEVDVGDHVHALTSLRNFDVDLGLVFNLPPEADVEAIAQFDQKLVAVMHRDHPLAGQETVRLRDCADYPVVLPDRDIAGRQMLERFMMRSSISLRPLIESNSFEFLRGCLYYDNAISFQIDIGAVTDGGAVVVKDIADRNFPRGKLVLASLRNRQLPTIAHAFAEHIRQTLHGRQDGPTGGRDEGNEGQDRHEAA